MALHVYEEKVGKRLAEREHPHNCFRNDGGITEYTTHLKPPHGKGFYHEICFENVHIGFGNVYLEKTMQLYLEADFDSVEMHFSLKGKSSAVSENFNRKINFESYQHNIIYAHQMAGQMEFDRGDMQILEINLAPDFFKRFLPEDSNLFMAFRNSIDKQHSALISPEHCLISLEMYQILNSIIHCDRKGIFKKIYLEAKIAELLLLQLEQLFKGTTMTSSLSKKDEEKIYAVRDFIADNLVKSCSLIDLAHQVGTNEFTLKKGFKELFGTTVFHFWNDLKMEQAKKVLLEGDLNISEISEMMGYKNPRHFSTAFKRKYQIIPSAIKKVNKI